jgi:hypothetical protein
MKSTITNQKIMETQKNDIITKRRLHPAKKVKEFLINKVTSKVKQVISIKNPIAEFERAFISVRSFGHQYTKG